MGNFTKFVPFFSEPPRIEISGGIVNIRLRSGAENTEMAMSVGNLIRAVERGQRAIKRYTDGDQTVIIDD